MLSVVGRCKTTSLMKLGYGELALEGNRWDMAEINLWALIVVKLSELGILKRYIILYYNRRLDILDITRSRL